MLEMKRIFVFTLVIVLISALFIVGCGQPAPAPAPAPAPTPAKPIKIGALMPLTGGEAMWGEWFQRSWRFALDEAGWKVAGRPIEYIVADEGFPDVSVCLERFKKLVEVDKIDIYSGPHSGGLRVAAYNYASGIPLITVNVSGGERGEFQFPYVFNAGQAYIDTNYSLGRYAAQEMGCKTASSIAWDFTCGRDFEEGFVTGFEEMGGKVIQHQYTELAAADYTPYFLAVKPADAFYSGILGGEGQLRSLSQGWELGLPAKMKWLVGGTAELESSEILNQLGDKALGVVYAGPYSPLLDNPANKEFVEKFKEKFGVVPTCWDALKYEEVQILLAGLKATGGDTNPDKLKKAIQSLQLDLPSGHLTFDEGRSAIRDQYIMKVEKVGGQYTGVIVKSFKGVKTRAPLTP
jgi:branched-chain amino acid transport system substrate-binding protein